MKFKHSCWSTFEELWVLGTCLKPGLLCRVAGGGKQSLGLLALTESHAVNVAKWSKSSKKWCVVEPKIYSRKNRPWVSLETCCTFHRAGKDHRVWPASTLEEGPMSLVSSSERLTGAGGQLEGITRQQVSRLLVGVIPAISLAKSV